MESSSYLQAGSELFDKSGPKIGTITDVVLESNTLEAEWYDVKVGRLGGHHLIPVDSVSVEHGREIAQFGKDMVKSAPNASSPPLKEEREALRAHYRAA